MAVFPDTANTVKEVVQSEGLGVHALAGVPLEKLKISATPTLLLVDRNGTVLNAWIGVLSPTGTRESSHPLLRSRVAAG